MGVSYRGEDLWYTNPGQQVQCSWCEIAYPQAGGQLLGAESRSVFAQNDFVCHCCLLSCSEGVGNAEDSWNVGDSWKAEDSWNAGDFCNEEEDSWGEGPGAEDWV